MTRFFRWSLHAYRAVLILYPEDLRRDFGPEMLDAFAEDLSNQCASHRFKGGIRVWRVALAEVLAIALPAWLQVPAIAVPLLSAAASIVSQSPMLIMTIQRESQRISRPGDPTIRDALVAVATGAVITALTSFIAVYRRRGSGLLSLSIGKCA
jgi:hypothetical protein